MGNEREKLAIKILKKLGGKSVPVTVIRGSGNIRIGGKGFKPIKKKTRKELMNYYIRNVKNLEKIIGVNLSKKWGIENVN